MAMYSTNLLPDVTGRTLGDASKRWDVFARNIDFTGTITGTGLQQSLVTNSTPNQDTFTIQSDTGTGGMLRRFRARNQAGSAKVDIEFQNAIVKYGSEQALLGGGAQVNYLSAATEPGLAVFNIFAAGQPYGGSKALTIANTGEITSFSTGNILLAYAAGDAQPKFVIDNFGSHYWGAGVAAAVDATLMRVAISRLAIGNGAGGYGTLDVGQVNFMAPAGTAPFTVVSSQKVVNLNADLLDGADWGAPPAIGNVAPGTGAFTNLSFSGQLTSTVATGTAPLVVNSTTPVANLTVGRVNNVAFIGVIPRDGAAKKHRRISVASLAAGARVTIDCVWDTPFASGNYSVTVAVFDSGNPGGPGLRVERLIGQNTTKSQVQIINDDSVAHTGTAHFQAELEV